MPSSTKHRFLQEHGFWDYTTPAAGGMEHYKLDDYRLLFDDMQSAGMNSLAISIKWFTTGYRSRLPFLDQNPKNRVIASDNELLHQVFDEAGRRGIAVWLSAVGSMYLPSKMKSPATAVGYWEGFGSFEYAIYDLDSREATDHAVAMFAEIVTLFPRAHGLVVEIEASGKLMPHRIPLYNRWARENGYPRFDKMGQMECRIPPLKPWRDYTTTRRVELSKRIEKTVRQAGFRGQYMMLCETGWQQYLIAQEVNVEMYHKACPKWSVLSYEAAYNKARNRYGAMEMAVEEPKNAGAVTYYLPRGVMSWVSGMDRWPLPITLEDSWKLDLEDIADYQPSGVWWFGSGGLRRGLHVDPARLRKVGFATCRDARLALLKMIRESSR
ncbi:MAG: hypothetical protein IT440_12120 [Phycisphaeraceae bacterium]|nr:hypothetical protein [Phycisphaeraceae bacterium]